MADAPPSSHSAEIRIWLDCGDYGSIPLGRVGRGIVVAKEPSNIPACMADLIVSVDGEIQRNRVRVTTGFRGRRLAKFTADDGIAPF